MAEIEHNANFKQWFNIFLVICEAWQGYELKAYGVLNHNLKLQSMKFSRTRDIPNFSTQGWADTAFYTSNWSETYPFAKITILHEIIQPILWLLKRQFKCMHCNEWKKIVGNNLVRCLQNSILWYSFRTQVVWVLIEESSFPVINKDGNIDIL